MATETIEDISLFNVCGGAADEQFQRSVQEIIENIADLNTDPKGKRELTLKFEFKPYKNRQGAEVTMTASTKLKAAEPISGNIFIQRGVKGIKGHARDPKQDALFHDQQTDKEQ